MKLPSVDIHSRIFVESFIKMCPKTQFSIPDKIPLLQRVQPIKILGVTFTSSLSVTLHVQSVIAACAQTLYALRVLRKHGLCDDSLHDIFRAVAVAKLMYASNAWWGFSNANDRQKIFAFIRRCIRTGFCSPDLADFHDLYISSAQTISYWHSSHHLLHKITVLEIDLTIDGYLTAFLE